MAVIAKLMELFDELAAGCLDPQRRHRGALHPGALQPGGPGETLNGSRLGLRLLAVRPRSR